MTTQPPSRTRFYLDKRNGKFMGVCSGIADYTGLDVTLVRIMFVSAVIMSGGGVLPLYFVAGFMADDKPRETTAAGCAKSTAAWPTSKAM